MKTASVIKSIEEAMVYGECDIAGMSFSNLTKEEKEADSSFAELLDKYVSELTPHEDLYDANILCSRAYEEAAFYIGFKLGARLMTEVLSDE